MKNFIITLLAIFTIAISATAQDTTSVIIPNRWLAFDNPTWEGKTIYDFITDTGDSFRVYENGFCVLSTAEDEFTFARGGEKIKIEYIDKGELITLELPFKPYANTYTKGYFTLPPELYLIYLHGKEGRIDMSVCKRNNGDYSIRIPTLVSSNPYRMNRPPYVYKKKVS